ncbi:MAG: HAMP domain-containing histidine kinase [Gemmatimonadaceae bacterium]|nr:HAMP domain-containing histidine kinase [Gemmatimonadaceae bacterium]
MNQLRFRTRLVLILSLFAIIPALLLTLLWSGTVSSALPLLSGRAGWDSVASTGKAAIAAARQAPLSSAQRAKLDAHERELRSSAEQARRFSFLAARTVRLVAFAGIVSLLVLTGAASRVAGHLSRQLSRPLDELVRWTDLLAHGQKLPPPAPQIVAQSGSGEPVTVTSRVRGAPEFEKLRRSMRLMAAEIEEGRKQAIEAERLRAFRESARRVAHELKNPLTPIRFAIEKLKRDSPYDLGDSIQVLETESKRLERMAASFAQFGKLPEGPKSEIDISELVTYAAKSTVPDKLKLDLEIAPGIPPVLGNHSAISGALSNVLLNAVDASKADGAIKVQVSQARIRDRVAVRISVTDNGSGIGPNELEHIWEPYVTHKPGGTGLGLSIARQAIWAHDGTVEAKSTLGEGTEIALTLPVSDNNGSRS